MTETFSAHWLALREDRYGAARSQTLALAFLENQPRQARIVDLGAGAGANARYLNRLAVARDRKIAWRLVDRDRALLDGVAGLPGAVREELDFAADPAVLDLAGTSGIGASALFDLVSRDWFTRFVAAAAGRPLLLALTARDGHRWYPGDASDRAVMDWFACDMRRDKGFGLAMGLAAPPTMVECLAEAGYRVRQAASDWRLDRGQPAMLNAMIETIAAAAAARGEPERVAPWRDRRRQCATEGGLRLVVPHRDILALPGVA